MAASIYAVKVKRWRNKLAAIKYLGATCHECGLICTLTNVGSFDFHHTDPSEKESTISKMLDRASWERIRIELDKCRLLCRNCHGVIHSISNSMEDFMNDVFDYDGGLDIWLWGRKQPSNPITPGSYRNECKCPYCNRDFVGQARRVYCSDKCADLASRKADRPTKEELKDLIDKNSWIALGRMFGVSDNAVRKWARSYGLLV